MSLFDKLDWKPANDNGNQYECPQCGRPSTYRVKTTCRACYQKNRSAKMPFSSCHPEKVEHAGGLCRPCYQAGYRGPRASCHPDKKRVAFDLCQDCYNNLPVNKARSIKKRRLRKYGLSDEQYQTMLDNQDGKCAICGDVPTAVDHDHSTGLVRGLLCHSCNAGLGHFRDSPSLLEKAARYIEETLRNAA